MRAGRRRVFVFGAGGHTGGELLRLLLRHPSVSEVVPITGSSEETLEARHPNLRGSGLNFRSLEEALVAGEPDVVFFALPTGACSRILDQRAFSSSVIIDLSADHRFHDRELLLATHGIGEPTHGRSAVYGMPEVFGSKIAGAKLIANPGCFALASLLCLLPLAGAEVLTAGSMVHVFGINGTTGAGGAARKALMHSEVHAGILPYGLDGHRHAPEIEHILERSHGLSIRVDLSTAHGSFSRGLYVQTTILLDRFRDMNRDALLTLLTDYYASNPWVHVVAEKSAATLNYKNYESYPRIRDVLGSNLAHLGADFDDRHGVVKLVAVIDNLGRGAASSAIQNMNIALGLAEGEGVRGYGLG